MAMEALGNVAPEEGSVGGAVGRRRFHEGDRKAAAAAEAAAAAAVSKSESVFIVLTKCYTDSIIVLVHDTWYFVSAGKDVDAEQRSLCGAFVHAYSRV